MKTLATVILFASVASNAMASQTNSEDVSTHQNNDNNTTSVDVADTNTASRQLSYNHILNYPATYACEEDVNSLCTDYTQSDLSKNGTTKIDTIVAKITTDNGTEYITSSSAFSLQDGFSKANNLLYVIKDVQNIHIAFIRNGNLQENATCSLGTEDNEAHNRLACTFK